MYAMSANKRIWAFIVAVTALKLRKSVVNDASECKETPLIKNCLASAMCWHVSSIQINQFWCEVSSFLSHKMNDINIFNNH